MWSLNNVTTVFWIALTFHNNVTHLFESIKIRPLTSVLIYFFIWRPVSDGLWKTSTEELHNDMRSDDFSFFKLSAENLTICYCYTLSMKMIKWGCSCLNSEFWIALMISKTFNSNLNWHRRVQFKFWESKSAWGKMLKNKKTKLHCIWCFNNLQ